MSGIEELIRQLSDDEKIRLLNGDGSWNTWSANGKLPSFCVSDGPHGLRKQDFENYKDINTSNVATCFPTASCIASSWSRECASALAAAISKEAKKENVDVVLGPGINIKRSPLCGRNFEYFSEDPYLAGTLASSYVNSMQENGTGTSVKHFAANSQEKRRQTSNSIIDERTLHEIYLRAFEIVVKTSNPVSIMGSYNRLNGEYVCASKKMINGILREKWNYEGLVISDWGACMNPGLCLNAGLDLTMPDSLGYFSRRLKKDLADGIISRSTIENADRRILNLAEKYSSEKSKEKSTEQLENKSAEKNKLQVDYNEQHKTALHLAQESAVLLKNDGVLPLKKCSVAIIGELAECMKFQGVGSSHITTSKVVNAIDAFKNEGYEVHYSKGYHSGFVKQKHLYKMNIIHLEPALILARKAAKENMPVLFFTGLTDRYEGEGYDRKSLSLPVEQLYVLKKVLEITDNVIVINFSGSPVTLPFENNVRAVLQMYLCGQACAQAIVSIVEGKINPSGHLAETYPLNEEDISCVKNFGGEEDNIEYREQLFVGYRWYETKNISVQHEFGFGLSYTTFDFTNMKVHLPYVDVTVKNTGKVSGAEVIQIYTENPAGTENIQRPLKELRGFEKVYLLPGETKTVSILLDENTFKVYSTITHCFETCGGTYRILAGASVKDIRCSEKIEVAGKKLDELCVPVTEDFYKSMRIVKHSKGNYTVEDSLGEMAKTSLIVRFIKFLVSKGMLIFSVEKSREDPAIQIELSAVEENPVESFISVSNGFIKEKGVNRLVKIANGRKRNKSKNV